MDDLNRLAFLDPDFEDDGQPSEYEEWQDYMGGDDWDNGQYDEGGWQAWVGLSRSSGIAGRLGGTIWTLGASSAWEGKSC